MGHPAVACLETLYRYAGRFGSPHHIGCADAAGERNNKVRLPSQHLLVSDRSCRAPVGFPISRADVPLNLRLGRCPFHCELIGSRRSTLHQFRYGLLLVQPVERTKDLRRASEIPSSANQDLHGFPCFKTEVPRAARHETRRPIGVISFEGVLADKSLFLLAL